MGTNLTPRGPVRTREPVRSGAGPGSAAAAGDTMAAQWLKAGMDAAQSHEWAKALAAFDSALALDPALAEAYYNRGIVRTSLARFEDALADYDRVIALEPDFAPAYSNRGVVQRALRQPDAALASYAMALSIDETNADAHYNRGNLLKELGQLAAAVASYDRAIELDPGHADAHYNRGFTRLLTGQLAQGWPDYEWRRTSTVQAAARGREFSRPLWSGEESLVGKTVLLHAEQGLGDTLQFCRYVPLVAQLGARVILEVPASLVRLLSTLPGLAHILARGDALPAFDVHCPLLSLPRAFHTDLSSIPSAGPYLAADAGLVAHWQTVLGPKRRPRIGLAWSGNPAHANDRQRSIALAELLSRLPTDYDYVSVQNDVRDHDRVALASSGQLRAFTEELRDFADTAALCMNLDLVISVDTSVAHLGAALGIATWILLPSVDTDWRWLLERDDSPWYASVKLYRQPCAGDWASLFARLRADLPAAVAAAGRALPRPAPPGAASASAPAVPSARPQSEVERLLRLAIESGQAGDLPRAIDSLRQILRIDPAHRIATYNLGIAFYNLRRFEPALAGFDRAITLLPQWADAHFFRGNTLRELGRLAESRVSFERAIALAGDHEEYRVNLGNVLRDLGEPAAALEQFDRALALRPHCPEAYQSRGVVEWEQRRLPEALAAFGEAIRLRPDFAQARTNRALAWLLTGDFVQGWAEHEWRRRDPDSPLSRDRREFAQPLWLGQSSIAGKVILLHSEQGLGDSIQFCRYATRVAELGARVLLEVPAPLERLMQGLAGVSQVVPRGRPLPSFDLQTSLMSLPLAFKTTLADVPAAVPYLRSDPHHVEAWRSVLGERRRCRVGLVWSGGFRPHQPELHAVNARRNIPLSALARLRLPNIDFYSLQKGHPAETELAQLSAARWDGPDIQDHTRRLNDFADTAALIQHLDLVISVDTATAHLAAALGKPVWILNRFDACWRWLLDRTDSPWYPTATLYRQPRPGDWNAVLDRVRVDLQAFAHA